MNILAPRAVLVTIWLPISHRWSSALWGATADITKFTHQVFDAECCFKFIRCLRRCYDHSSCRCDTYWTSWLFSCSFLPCRPRASHPSQSSFDLWWYSTNDFQTNVYLLSNTQLVYFVLVRQSKWEESYLNVVVYFKVGCCRRFLRGYWDIVNDLRCCDAGGHSFCICRGTQLK